MNQRYWLVETRAPAGHDLHADAVEFTVTPAGIALIPPAAPSRSVAVAADRPFALTVTDRPTATLPRAGGPGPFAHLAAGLLLLAAAAVAAAVSRRRPTADGRAP